MSTQALTTTAVGEHQHTEFLLAIFTESRAAEVPRTFGLAPPEASKETRKAFFDSMEDEQMRGVTFRLLAWTVEHPKGKTALQKSGLTSLS